MIGQERLDEFLRGRLAMSASDMDLLMTDRYSFLEKLLNAFECHIPWQNLSYTAVPLEDRLIPKLAQVIENVLSGVGGMCWTINAGLGIILTELGYDVTYILGAVVSKTKDLHHNYTHIMLLITSLVKKNDRYLVDLGFGGDNYKPVSLDFDVESPAYKKNRALTKWVKKGSEYIRCDKFNTEKPGRWPTKEGFWDVTIFFNLKPWKLEDIRDVSIRDACSKVKMVFNVHRQIVQIMPETGKKVSIFNNTLRIENDPDSPMEKVTFENVDELVVAARKYFVNVPANIVKAAYEVWYRFDKDKPI
jgi:arylamine N-acetyltransferase